MNYFIYVISIATCKPNLCVHMYLLRAKQILLVHFIIIRTFRVAQKMLCTPWLRNPLTSSKLSCLGRKRPRRQFFFRYVKE
jgi:hypothetical protein